MGLEVRVAEVSDAERIAEIHMAAFGSNAMLQAQFPTSSARHELRQCIVEKTRGDMHDDKVVVLVVYDGNEIISFAKWTLPISESENHTEFPWRWPEETNFDVLHAWAAKVKSAREVVIGNLPCYCQCLLLNTHYILSTFVRLFSQVPNCYRPQLHRHRPQAPESRCRFAINGMGGGKM